MHDAHLHISDIAFFKEMQKHQIEGIANAASPQEYHFLKELQAQYPKLRISAGIHPWQADAITWEAMLAILQEAEILGETSDASKRMLSYFSSCYGLRWSMTVIF